MNQIAVWSLIIGAIFLLSGLAKEALQRTPVSLPFLYLLIGCAIGPLGLDIIQIQFFEQAKTLEVLTEIAVLLSVFGAGLRLKPLYKKMLVGPVKLALIAMMITIALIAATGVYALGLSLGAAILLGAILAPTDPVLAAAVQVESEDDTDTLRFNLTGEAGLNDGTAFPFIMLGLGLLQIHNIGTYGWRWVVIDVLWATFAAIAIGIAVGYGIAYVAVVFHRRFPTTKGYEELLSIGVIGLTYGLALASNSYGFLAVFFAALAVRYVLEHSQGSEYTTTVNTQLSSVLEIMLVVLMGVLLTSNTIIWSDWWFALVLFLCIRPLAVMLTTVGDSMTFVQRYLTSFFGIRGIGSLYYLSYAITAGLTRNVSQRLIGITVLVIAFSLLIHSNPASLLLRSYKRSK